MKRFICFLFLLCISQATIANVVMNFNNKSSHDFWIVSRHANKGGLYLPETINAYSNIQGHSTSSSDLSEGNFEYVYKQGTVLKISYTQTWFITGTKYDLDILQCPKTLKCKATRSKSHSSVFTIDIEK